MKRAKGMPGIRYMILLFSILFLISPVLAGEGTTIFVNDVSANYSYTIQIPVNISNAKDIGSIDISLRYDPNVLSLKNVEKGNRAQNSVIQWNTEGDKVLIGLIDGNGINGNGSLTIITFDVCGYQGSTSVLDLDATVTNGTDFLSMQLTTKNGIFTVIGGTKLSPTVTPTSIRSGSSGSGRIITLSKSDGLEHVIISIENVYAYPNSTIKIPINVQNASNIGSVDFYLHFNSSVLHLIDISKSKLTANSLLQWSINESKIRILIIDASGINGNGSLAYLNFNVIGAPRSIANLNISELEMSNAVSTAEIPATINNGTLVVKPSNGNKTPAPESAQEEHEPSAKRQPGFEALTSASAIALITILFMLKRDGGKKR